MATFTDGEAYFKHLDELRKEERMETIDLVEKRIGEIHDMLIDYMNEDAATPILDKIRELADTAGCRGYQQGWDEGDSAIAMMN